MIRSKSILAIFICLVIEYSNGAPNVIENQISHGGEAVITRNLIGTDWTQIGEGIVGEDNNNRFGFAVAMSRDGKRMAAGAPGAPGAPGKAAGHVRVYEWIDDKWQKVGDNIVGTKKEKFGSSIALSRNGNRVAIGGSGHGGLVRVYDYNGSTWVRAGKEITGEKEDDDAYRISLSSNGNRLAIGANGHDNNTGQVRVFYWDRTSYAWIMDTTLYGAGNGEKFGIAVSLSADGRKLAVASKTSAEIVIYEVNSGKDVGVIIDERARLKKSGEPLSLSGDGNRLAFRSKPKAGTKKGTVKVFEMDGSNWTQVGMDMDLTGDYQDDRFGFSLDLSTNGKRLAVGARGPTNANSQTNATHFRGYAKVFDWDATTKAWTQVGDTINGESNKDDARVVALSADGKKLAIGAPKHEQSHGQVRIFSDSSEDGTYGNITDQISKPSVNATSASEYVVTYDILTNGTYKFNITQDDCETPIKNTPIVLLNETYEFNKTIDDYLNVTMLLDLTTLAKDEQVYYLTKDKMYAEISFCMTVELHKDPSTMNLYFNSSNTTSGYVAYRSTVIRATLDLSQEFEGSVMVEDITTADFQDQLTSDLKVNSYMCMPNGTEIQASTPLYTNEDFYFCVDVTSLEYAKIDSIQELMFKSENQWIYLPISQGESKSELIDDPDLNTVSQKGIIRLEYLPVILYSSVEDKQFKVVISGTVILTFGSRMLEVSFESVPRRDRELQPSSDQASFESVVEFTKNDTNDDDKKQGGMFAGIAVGSALVVGVVLMISFKRRKSKNAIVNVEACDLVEIGVDSGTNKGGVSS